VMSWLRLQGERPIDRPRHYWQSLLLWPRWIWLSTLGSMLGWFLATFIGFLTIFVGFLAAGGVVGLAVGWAQGRFLRNAGPARIDSVQWEKSTAWGGAAALLAYPFMFSVPNEIFQIYRSSGGLTAMELLSALAGAAVLGTFQWRTLRKYLQSAAWWIPANLVGWGVGWYTADTIITSLLSGLPSPDGPAILASAFFLYVEVNMATVIANAVTGLVLLWLLRQPRPEAHVAGQ